MKLRDRDYYNFGGVLPREQGKIVTFIWFLSRVNCFHKWKSRADYLEVLNSISISTYYIKDKWQAMTRFSP